MLHKFIRYEIPLFIGYMTTGCCSNVYTFERLIKINSKTTTLLTLCQYIFIFSISIIYLIFNKYWLNNNNNNYKTKFYLPKYFIPVLFQTLTSHMSNYVFQLGFTIPTHIIIRSMSTTITMILGLLIWKKSYNRKKSYNWKKIIGSIMVVIGNILFTFDLENIKFGNIKLNNNDSYLGILILIFADLINSIVMLYKENIYQNNEKGNNHNKNLEWKSALFYYNFYAIIFYIPFSFSIKNEFNLFMKNLNDNNDNYSEILQIILWNLITQLSCILGVNILVFKISALSMSVIMLLRRFISLFLSIYIFNKNINILGYFSIGIVILGTFIYAISDVEWKIFNKIGKKNIKFERILNV